MRKYIIGFLVGAALMLSVQAFGSTTSLIGRSIQGEVNVKVNGANVGSGIVIDGKSYLPVRAIADKIKYNIVIGKGEVQLNAPDRSSQASEIARREQEAINAAEEAERQKRIAQVKEEQAAFEKSLQINSLKSEIRIQERAIDRAKQMIEILTPFKDREQEGKDIIMYQEQITKYEQQIASIEAKLAELEGK